MACQSSRFRPFLPGGAHACLRLLWFYMSAGLKPWGEGYGGPESPLAHCVLYMRQVATCGRRRNYASDFGQARSRLAHSTNWPTPAGYIQPVGHQRRHRRNEYIAVHSSRILVLLISVFISLGKFHVDDIIVPSAYVQM